MKKTGILAVAIGLSMMVSCGVMDQNIKARENLKNCTFECEKLELDKIEFKGIKPASVFF